MPVVRAWPKGAEPHFWLCVMLIRSLMAFQWPNRLQKSRQVYKRGATAWPGPKVWVGRATNEQAGRAVLDFALLPL